MRCWCTDADVAARASPHQQPNQWRRDQRHRRAVAAARLPGLEVAEALRRRSFWTISLASFCFGFYASGMYTHFITYLIGTGYLAFLCRLSDELGLLKTDRRLCGCWLIKFVGRAYGGLRLSPT
jgi:hypothetical protein